jgi:hypothetical protein
VVSTPASSARRPPTIVGLLTEADGAERRARVMALAAEFRTERLPP